jgi:Fic family protein
MGWIADLLSEIPSAAKYKIQLEQLEKENISLKKQVNMLKSGLDKSTKEIDRLNLLIQGPKQKNQNKYNEVTEKIIKLFFDVGDNLSIDNIVRTFSIDSSTVRYHLDILLDDGLIEETTNVFANTLETFLITKAGRKYIVET